jgi:hypothetical protein
MNETKTAQPIDPEDAEALDALADVFWREALAELETQRETEKRQSAIAAGEGAAPAPAQPPFTP